MQSIGCFSASDNAHHTTIVSQHATIVACCCASYATIDCIICNSFPMKKRITLLSLLSLG